MHDINTCTSCDLEDQMIEEERKAWEFYGLIQETKSSWIRFTRNRNLENFEKAKAAKRALLDAITAHVEQ